MAIQKKDKDKKEEEVSNRVEVKQAVIDRQAVKENTRPGQKLIKIAGFHGPYLDAIFGDDGVSKGPVRPDTLKHLRRDFPFAEIEEIADQGQG